MILTIISFPKNGKGDGDMINFDKSYYIEEFLDENFLNSIEFNKYRILICDFNEDGIRGDCKKKFRTLDNMLLLYKKICERALEKNPHINIYQHPEKCSWIGNKNKTNKILSLLLNEDDIFLIPKTYTISSYEEIGTIDKYPVLMKINKNLSKTSRTLDTIVYSNQEAKNIYNKTFQKNKNVISLEVIDSYISKLKCFHVIRLFVVNDMLVDWSIRPSKEWNIHASNTKVSKINDAEKYIEPVIKNNISKIMCFIKKVYSITGNGFYSWDLIYSEKVNKFYICEIGLKYFDIYMENRTKGRIDKLSMNRDKMREFYVSFFKGA